MGKISGTLTEETRILIYDLQTNTVVIDEVKPAGEYEFLGLTSYEKWISGMNTTTGQAISYGKFVPASEPPVEAEFPVIASLDDGEARSFAITTNDSENWLSTDQYGEIFTRFQNINIPQGSSIEYAYLTMVGAKYYASSGWCEVVLGDIDNAYTITSWNEFHAYPRTAATAWKPAGSSIGVSYNTPDFSTIFESIVNKSGWVSGNSIMIILENTGSTYKYKSYDAGGSNIPLLKVRFVAP